MTTANIGSTPTLSKPEAVRRAIAALGFRAEVPELLAYIEKNFVLADAEAMADDRQHAAQSGQAAAAEAPLADRASPEEPARAARRGKGR